MRLNPYLCTIDKQNPAGFIKRNDMNKVLKYLTIVLMTITASHVTAQTGGASAKSKILVAYFSWSGNTQAVAEQIAGQTGGQLFKIETVKAYPEEYRPCTEVAKVERDNDARPALKSSVDNMAQYDIVMIGYPNWWGTMPMAVKTFIESYDLSGKTVIPFCTHGGGGVQNCFRDFLTATPSSEHKEGLLLNGSAASSCKERVEKWLQKIGISGR